MPVVKPASRRGSGKRPVLLAKTGTVIAALLLAVSTGVTLAAPPVYDVEIIIFRNKVNSDAGEQWPTQAAGDLQPTRVFSQDEFTELSASDYQLDAIRGGLRNSSGYTVLLHRAWRQVGYDAGHAIAYPINTRVDSGNYSLQGSVTLVRERYLHLDVDLQLTTEGSTSPARYSAETVGKPAYRLHENRRMRSRELHYFDHPRFGMIATVTPYDAPEDEPEPEPDATDAEPEAADIPISGPGPDDDQLTR